MHHPSPLVSFFLERLRRSLIACVGLLLFSFGFYLQAVASIGFSPWQALYEGMTLHLPITMGQASIIISVLVIVSDILMREPIGLGTILDTVVVGFGLDFFLWLNLLPYQTSFWPGLALLIVALMIMSLGQVFHMKAGLSCGPRDALMVAIGKRFPRISVGTISIAMSLTVLFVGFLLGGSVGFGTMVNLFCTGTIMDLVFHLCRFEPRTVTHEGLEQTILAFSNACKAEKDASRLS